MTPGTGIVPWKCHACGVRFAETSGGVCSGCGRVTCSACLVPGQKIGKSEVQRCRGPGLAMLAPAAERGR
jgi:hypothetical protein